MDAAASALISSTGVGAIAALLILAVASASLLRIGHLREQESKTRPSRPG